MLDKNKPYGTCGHNIFGKRYHQNNKFFNVRGEDLDFEEEVKLSEPDEIDYSQMSWREVKELVVKHGGKWTNTANGIDFLRNL